MNRKGWVVALAALGLNLALGILYAWSVFSEQLTEPVDRGGFGWTRLQATLPYAAAIACVALTMVSAGRLQDRFGPRLVATAGSALAGAGLIVASLAGSGSILPAVLGFGFLGGTGIGLGCAAAMPAAARWFLPEHRGLVTGLVVAGLGLAPVYVAPASRALLRAHGVGGSLRLLGLAFFALAAVLAQLVSDPRKVPGPARRAGA
jgi:MFS family permease